MVPLSDFRTEMNQQIYHSNPAFSRCFSPRFKSEGGPEPPMAKQLPCVPMGCSACCRETTMPLTISEAKRLSRRTGIAVESFTWENKGVLTLLNDEKTRACVFLLTTSSEPSAEGICSVYEVRPEGCRKYPIVLNSKDDAILDDGCPHRSQFPQPTEDDAIALLNLEERLMRK